MKKLIILTMLNLLFMGVQAQTYSEFFQQKKMQKKYLIQQIAALKIYLKAVEKGYSIAKKGLTTIGAIKDGDFNLHSEYFSSLELVNPEIADHDLVRQIYFEQTAVLEAYEYFYSQVQDSEVFSEAEVQYIYQVYQRLLDDCSGVVDELITITTSERLEMKDDERLARIQALYADMQDKYTFAQDFGKGAMLMAVSRIQEQNNIQTIRILNDIKTD